MSIAAFLWRRAELARKKRQLAQAEEWARTLQDQVSSGQHALYGVLQRVDQLKAEVWALESPDDVIRRAGVGA